MVEIKCPFLRSFKNKIKCPYLIDRICYDISIAPRNNDAWCSQMIKKALGLPKKQMKQNYSCPICGLESFVIYNTNESWLDIAIKIGKDHKKKNPRCLCLVDGLDVVGEPTKI